jgi:hypothetical protein
LVGGETVVEVTFPTGLNYWRLMPVTVTVPAAEQDSERSVSNRYRSGGEGGAFANASQLSQSDPVPSATIIRGESITGLE